MSMLTVLGNEKRELTVADYEARIELYKEQIGTGYIGIGRTLIEAKESGTIEHGAWESWVERVTGLTMRQAQRCMQAAREIRDGSAMARLEMSKALMLLQSGLDEETREEIAGRAEAEGATVRQLREEIARTRQEMEEKEAEAAEAVKALKGQLVRESGTTAEIRQALRKAEGERDQVAAQMRAAQDAWQGRLDDEVGKAYLRGTQENTAEIECEVRKELQGRIDFANQQRRLAEDAAKAVREELENAEKERQKAWDDAYETGKYQAGQEWKAELDELAARKLESDDRANALELDMLKLEKEAEERTEEVERLREELAAAERREEKRSAQMARMQEQIGQREMDAARGVRAGLSGEMDLSGAVRKFLAEVGMLPQMGAMLSGIGEGERQALRAHVETVGEWVRGARAALEAIGADGAVM